MEAKNAPLIRFYGYSEDWQTQKLKHLCNTFIDGDWIESKDQSKSGIRLIQTGNIGIAKFLDKPNNAKWISNETFESLHCNEIFHNDILISRLPEPAGRACLLPNLHYRCITAVDCSIVRCNEKNDSSFIVQFLSSPKYFKEVTLLLAGGTRQRISRKNLEEITIKTPLLSEQTRIASLFTALDKQISCSEAKLDKLRTIKKTLLKKMFASQGEKTPQIRFKGFDGEWEEKKLGEIMTGFEYGLNASAKQYDGQNKYLRITDIDEDSRKFVRHDLTSPNCDLNESDSYILKKGDICFARTGASVGKTYSYDEGDGKVYYAGFLIKASCITEMNPEFIFQNTLTKDYLDYIRITSQRSGQPGVNAQEFASYKLLIPNQNSEQTRIASLFSALDKQISLQEQKIEKLKAVKKTLLKKMFV